MAVVSLFINMHFLFTFDVYVPSNSKTPVCLVIEQYTTELWLNWFHVIAFVLRTVMPFIILLASNVFIVSRIVNSIRERTSQMQAARSTTEKTNDGKVYKVNYLRPMWKLVCLPVIHLRPTKNRLKVTE